MIKICPKELISDVPDIQSVSLPNDWFLNIDYDGRVFNSLYDWMVKEGGVPKKYADNLHNLTYVGEAIYKKLMAAEKKRLKNKYHLEKIELENAVGWADLGSGPISEIYNCRIRGDCILVIPESSSDKLYQVAAKVFQRENEKIIAKTKDKAAGTTFYQWLISQIERPDDVGLLANEAKLYKAFPRDAVYCEEIESYLGTQDPLLDALQQGWFEYVSQYPERIKPYAWCNECNEKISIKMVKIIICEGSCDIDILCEKCVPKVFRRSSLYEMPLFQTTQEQLKEFAKSHSLDEFEIKPIIERLKIWGIFALNEIGFIYFVQSTNNREIKIGYSTDPLQRVNNLQTAHPCPLKLLATIPGDMKFERSLHRKFLEFKIQGEWFKPHPDILEYISKIKVVGSEGEASII